MRGQDRGPCSPPPPRFGSCAAPPYSHALGVSGLHSPASPPHSLPSQLLAGPGSSSVPPPCPPFSLLLPSLPPSPCQLFYRNFLKEQIISEAGRGLEFKCSFFATHVHRHLWNAKMMLQKLPVINSLVFHRISPSSKNVLKGNHNLLIYIFHI